MKVLGRFSKVCRDVIAIFPQNSRPSTISSIIDADDDAGSYAMRVDGICFDSALAGARLAVELDPAATGVAGLEVV